jgi:hypothetical protein
MVVQDDYTATHAIIRKGRKAEEADGVDGKNLQRRSF